MIKHLVGRGEGTISIRREEQTIGKEGWGM